MCTVSYLPQKNGSFVFTSNRDEAVGRKTIFPKVYLSDKVKVLMPKDEIAGGTWIGVSDKSRLVCLLNGGFEKHTIKAGYKHSRGKVVNDFLKIDDFQLLLSEYDLKGVEPFTLVILDWSDGLVAYELVWDELEKHISELDTSQPKIWSSATLYTQEMKQIRNQWFLNYFAERELSKENALDFHKNYGIGDKNLDLQIDRGVLKTVSVTNVVKNDSGITMVYEDLLLNKVYSESLNSEEVYG